MNHSILPLLIEKHAHCFSCYNGWKISPESLEDFIGIRTNDWNKEKILNRANKMAIEAYNKVWKIN